MENKNINPEIFDLLTHQGVLYEVNRVFFHPLGLSLSVTKDMNLVLEKEEDNKPVRFEKMDTLKQKMFRKFANKQYSKRQEKLGYVIQTQDSFATTLNLEKVTQSYEKKRFETLIKTLTCFTYDMSQKFIANHRQKDYQKAFPTKENIITKLNKAVQESQWVSVANCSMLLENYEAIEKALKTWEKEDEANQKNKAKQKN